MNIKSLTGTIGIIVLGLGVLGLIVGEQLLDGMMNTDIMLDITRVALGVLLLDSSRRDERSARTAFTIFGVIYLANLVIAQISPNMFGTLPNQYGFVDNVLHLGGGILGLLAAFIPRTITNQKLAKHG